VLADYNEANRITPQANFLTNRGDPYNHKGHYDRAIADSDRAINPQFDSAAENLAAVRVQRDRRGILSNHQTPTFNCRTAKRAVEKAICSDPHLSRLDRQIDDAYKAAQGRRDRKTIATLNAAQRESISIRNKSFGRPDTTSSARWRSASMRCGLTTAN
jgi:uncharacterized protein YecT (DUF1311 family)